MKFNKDKIKMKIVLSKIKDEYDVTQNNKSNSILKTVATIILGIALSTGAVFAGTKVYEVYEKIWKEPEFYNYSEYINQLPHEITEDEKKESISEEKAKKLGTEILNSLGYENQNINRIELKKGYIQNGRANYYMLKTEFGYEEGLMVMVDANTGDFICFEDLDLKYQHLPTQIITSDEISKIATDYCRKLKLKNDSYKISRYGDNGLLL